MDFFGVDNQLNKLWITETIANHITGETVYIVVTRKNSFPILQKELEYALADLLGTQNFLIWNTGFNTVIEFNHIGVLRKGHIENKRF